MGQLTSYLFWFSVVAGIGAFVAGFADKPGLASSCGGACALLMVAAIWIGIWDKL